MSKSQKKKLQKVDLKDTTSGKILLPGRRKCECMANIHQLINNCLICGRIVCEQEGEGSCFFCGNPVFSKMNPLFKELSSDQFVSLSEAYSKDSDMVREQAIKHKNKLLNYEKNMNPASNIIDDETDWYEVADNVWLSEKQREVAITKIKEEEVKKEEHSKGIGITFDLATKTFVADDKDYDESVAKEAAKEFMSEVTKKHTAKTTDGRLPEEFEKIHNEMTSQLKEEAKGKDGKKEPKKEKPFDPMLSVRSCRVQHDDIFQEFMKEINKKEQGDPVKDKDFYDEEIFNLEKDDTGSCLSMHQPWASLLVLGFKRFEGRQWSTKYRGPLWIQAGSKAPTQEEIKAVEAMYLDLYKDAVDMPPLPDRYPLSSLLGVVDLEEVCPNEIYQKVIPEEVREDSASKFLFVIRNPRKLLYPIKFSGQKMIFKIEDETLLNAAKNSLVKVKTNWFPYYANQLRGKVIDPYAQPTDVKNTPNLIKKESIRYSFRADRGAIFYDDGVPKDMLAPLIETFKEELLNRYNKTYVGIGKVVTLELSDALEAFTWMNKTVQGLIEQAFGPKEVRPIKKIDVCVVSDKEKPKNYGDKYIGMAFFGKGAKISLESKDQSTIKEYFISNNSICIRDFSEGYTLSFSGIERPQGSFNKNDISAKIVTQQLENTSMMVFFY
mmetsp:Transcript_5812/g.6256  ORF Transcript_5812/g.6256 Transcript_5812/m.6256 type:complete len:664 (+) Transcript_5812:37-2028(+)